jgi:hypothetical protein
MSPLRLPLLLALLVALALPAQAAAQAGATECPATFDVLHNDRIGQLQLEAGPYDVTVRGGLSCAEASDLFRQFLEDWDGRLPRPWVVDVATASFTRGRGGTVGFSVKRAGSHHGGGGGGHHGALACPAYFTVLHNDHIGSFAIPRGRYRITLVSASRLTCARASTLFARFLQDFDGILPRPWFLDPETATFLRGARNVGFRIKPWTGPLPPNGGGGRHPSDGSRCPATFRVLHNDRIGRLRLPRGPYYVTTLRGGNVSCQEASQLFAEFLDDTDGVLPRPWILNARTATFRQGRGSPNGFRVKLARVR